MELAVRADAVIREFYRAFAVSVGGQVMEADGVVACLGLHPSPIVTNTAWRADPRRDPEAAVRTVRAGYDERGFRGTLLTSTRTDPDVEEAARAAGWSDVEALPVMTMPRSDSPVVWPVPPDVAVRPLDPVADLAAFRAILIDGFFEGDEEGRGLVEATFSDPASLAGPSRALFIGSLDGVDVSVAGAWLIGSDAGIGWVATVPEARRRGLGALVTARSVEWAFSQGAEVAVLQASPSGRLMYERLGFTTVGTDRLWEWPAR